MKMNKATIVTGLAFGDEGKGSIVDYIARRDNSVSAVVRFNGGGQAAHNVVTTDGRHHPFAQFGSATFLSGVKTFLSRFHLLDPFSLVREAKHLEELGISDILSRLYVDENAIVVTPFHKAANKLTEESRGNHRHGSCGMGIGETVSDSINYPDYTIRAKDLYLENKLELKFKLFNIQKLKREKFNNAFDNKANILYSQLAIDNLAEQFALIGHALNIVPSTYLADLADDGDLIFEGAQGVLLDEKYGFHPYTTWSTTTNENALTLLSEIKYSGEIDKVGVLRTYFTRHGPGPFPTQDASMSNVEPHNGFGEWQREFRQGWFDCVLAKYALKACPVDKLALTHTDIVPKQLCYNYGCGLNDFKLMKLPTSMNTQIELTNILLNNVVPEYSDIFIGDSRDYIAEVGYQLATPINIISFGPRSDQKTTLGG